MSNLTYLTEQQQALNTLINNIILNAKKFNELDPLVSLQPTDLLAIYNGTETQKATIQQIINYLNGVVQDSTNIAQLTTETNLDNLTNQNLYFFDTINETLSTITYTVQGGAATPLSTIAPAGNTLEGATLKVERRHLDNANGFLHITQVLTFGYEGKTFIRQYNSEENHWYNWQESTSQGGTIETEIAEALLSRKTSAWGYLSESTMTVTLYGTGSSLLAPSTTNEYITGTNRRQQTSVVAVGEEYGVKANHRYGRMDDFFYFRFEGRFQGSANAAIFIGVSNSNASFGNVDPSTLTDIVLIGKDEGDTNLHLIHNDAAGIATKVDLGSNFDMTVTRSVIVEMYSIQDSTNVYYKVTDPNNGNTTGFVEVSSDLPSSDLTISCRGMANRRNDSTTTMLMQFKNISINV